MSEKISKEDYYLIIEFLVAFQELLIQIKNEEKLNLNLNLNLKLDEFTKIIEKCKNNEIKKKLEDFLNKIKSMKSENSFNNNGVNLINEIRKFYEKIFPKIK